jgi:hypothetical protein
VEPAAGLKDSSGGWHGRHRGSKRGGTAEPKNGSRDNKASEGAAQTNMWRGGVDLASVWKRKQVQSPSIRWLCLGKSRFSEVFVEKAAFGHFPPRTGLNISNWARCCCGFGQVGRLRLKKGGGPRSRPHARARPTGTGSPRLRPQKHFQQLKD